MSCKKPTQITSTDAARAIYIDFEGTALDPPSFLGAAWAEVDEFRQNVREQGFSHLTAGLEPSAIKSALDDVCTAVSEAPTADDGIQIAGTGLLLTEFNFAYPSDHPNFQNEAVAILTAAFLDFVPPSVRNRVAG